MLPAIVLILLSIGLTLLGGIIPSRKAAKSDPVTALRTEIKKRMREKEMDKRIIQKQ